MARQSPQSPEPGSGSPSWQRDRADGTKLPDHTTGQLSQIARGRPRESHWISSGRGWRKTDSETQTEAEPGETEQEPGEVNKGLHAPMLVLKMEEEATRRDAGSL